MDLEDYHIGLAQELVQGVDVWINNPRRPWEACGTSGMKVLVNGGLNCSVRDGWWDEAWKPELGWAIGEIDSHLESDDKADAESLYDVLENKIVPEFYDRDKEGLPRRWLARIRESMAELTPVYSSTRMVREYVEKAYLPAAADLRRRTAENCGQARALHERAGRIATRWASLHVGHPALGKTGETWSVSVPVSLGELNGADVLVQVYADPAGEAPGSTVTLARARAIPGAVNGFVYTGAVPASRPAGDYTVRAIAAFDGAHVPAELPLIAWQS
jgi:starch phosphorylase